MTLNTRSASVTIYCDNILDVISRHSIGIWNDITYTVRGYVCILYSGDYTEITQPPYVRYCRAMVARNGKKTEARRIKGETLWCMLAFCDVNYAMKERLDVKVT